MCTPSALWPLPAFFDEASGVIKSDLGSYSEWLISAHHTNFCLTNFTLYREKEWFVSCRFNSCLHYGTMPLFGVRRANRRRDIVPPHRHVFYFNPRAMMQHSARILHTHSAAVPKITIILTEYLMFTPRTYIHRYCKYYMHMIRSQMLQKVHYNLPAKFWRLVGCTDIVSR